MQGPVDFSPYYLKMGGHDANGYHPDTSAIGAIPFSGIRRRLEAALDTAGPGDDPQADLEDIDWF